MRGETDLGSTTAYWNYLDRKLIRSLHWVQVSGFARGVFIFAGALHGCGAVARGEKSGELWRKAVNGLLLFVRLRRTT